MEKGPENESKEIENVKVRPTIINKQIIIPPLFRNETMERNYFIPRFLHLVKDRSYLVEWENQDDSPHYLVFYDMSVEDRSTLLCRTEIQAKQAKTLRFNFKRSIRIDYFCELHENESGTVVIYPKEEKDMSNTEQLRFLQQIFDL